MSGKRFMPVPGDIVQVRILEDGQTVVERIEPRGFTLERRSAVGRTKTMAANVDLLVTVTALANPPPRLVTLDQLLAFAELEEHRGRGRFYQAGSRRSGADRVRLMALYRGLEYPTIRVNPKTRRERRCAPRADPRPSRDARRELGRR